MRMTLANVGSTKIFMLVMAKILLKDLREKIEYGFYVAKQQPMAAMVGEGKIDPNAKAAS